jgi:DnaJ-class molecular chaperone
VAELLDCPDCEGRGEVLCERDCWSYKRDCHYTESEWRTCEACRGLGHQRCYYCGKPAVAERNDEPLCADCLKLELEDAA